MSGARVFVLGTSHHTAPVPVRERLTIPPDRMGPLLEQLRALAGLQEAVVLNTCNRLEVYAVLAAGVAETQVEELICRFQGFPAAEFAHYRFAQHDGDAIRHLLEVACGADSQIVGETEIFGQVKSAYSIAASCSTVGPVLNRIFQKTFHAAKVVRNATRIGEGQVSVATVAVDLAGKIFGDLCGCRVLVIGTGEVGEKTTKALHSRGVASITVLSRLAARAQALAAAVGAQAGTLEAVTDALPAHDIVIGCTTVTAPVITANMVQGAAQPRGLRPVFLIDLGVPRNFEAAAGEIDSVFLYDLDDLARIADENLAARRAAVDRCRQLARERAERIWSGLGARLSGATAAFDETALTPHEQAG